MRKISRRSFLKASAVVAGAAALAACGGSDSSSTAASTAGSTAASGAASEGGATNLVWTIWDKESTAYWQAMADGYMASHDNVTIEMLDLGSTDYMTVLATQLAGAADIDVLSIKDIPGYANLINLDYLAPMNDVLTRDTADFNGTIEQLTTDDGNFYAVPFRNDFCPPDDQRRGRRQGLRHPLPHLALLRVPVLHPGRREHHRGRQL